MENKPIAEMITKLQRYVLAYYKLSSFLVFYRNTTELRKRHKSWLLYASDYLQKLLLPKSHLGVLKLIIYDLLLGLLLHIVYEEGERQNFFYLFCPFCNMGRHLYAHFNQPWSNFCQVLHCFETHVPMAFAMCKYLISKK